MAETSPIDPAGLVVVAALLCLAAAGLRAGEIAQPYQQAIEKQLAKIDKGVAEGPYKPGWEDLKRHTAAPEWFRDAKFGIYWHWGVYAVPAHGNEWYPKWMHTKEGRRSYYKHHVETYGEPDKFGYHDFIPMFKAEKFDAEGWAELLAKAGARYAGPVCEHHDGYAMWASALTPWNAAETGPKRDITGELARAIRKRGMKFVTTFHHERTRTWYPRVEGWPTTTTDPKLRMLYANVSETLFNKIFLAKLGEVIDKYQPDLIWFDGQMSQIQDPYHLRFLAYYFSSARKWGRDVVVTTKKHQYPPEISVEDFEKGRTNRLTEFCWLTDDTISMGSWCYTTKLKIKSTRKVLHDFIDIVSKNGCLLLNISPKADGTIPAVQRKVLLGLGAWLKVGGEAIYNTRPWLAFGEGPTRLKKSGGFVGHPTYTPKDIRYTRSKDGKWACQWEITDAWARLTVLRADHAYWFLYEGTPGGKLDVARQFCVRSGGMRTPAGRSWTGDLPGDEWVYFGDKKLRRVLYLVHHERDEHVDSYWPMQGNMTVFGFGRKGLTKHMTKVPARFTVGFCESTDPKVVAAAIAAVTRPPKVTVRAKPKPRK